MAYYTLKDPDVAATDKIFKKIMSTGRSTSRSVGHKEPSLKSGGCSATYPTVWKSNKVVWFGKKTPLGAPLQTKNNIDESALKRGHETLDNFASSRYSPHPQPGRPVSGSSRKRVFVTSLSSKTPTPVPHTRSPQGVTPTNKVLDSQSWNASCQAQRLEKEWSKLYNSRKMKRTSEILKHRVDNMYMMSGAGIPLRPKYQVNDDELQQLKELSEARKLLHSKSKKYQPRTGGRKQNEEKNKKSPGNNEIEETQENGAKVLEANGTENIQAPDWTTEQEQKMPSPNESSEPDNKENKVENGLENSDNKEDGYRNDNDEGHSEKNEKHSDKVDLAGCHGDDSHPDNKIDENGGTAEEEKADEQEANQNEAERENGSSNEEDNCLEEFNDFDSEQSIEARHWMKEHIHDLKEDDALGENENGEENYDDDSDGRRSIERELWVTGRLHDVNDDEAVEETEGGEEKDGNVIENGDSLNDR